MELYTDKYYIERIKEGDTACFACLLDKYSNQVHLLIYRIILNKEDAEELTQDVFLKVYKNLDSFKGESRFSTWLYRIAWNTAISHSRRKKREFLAIDEQVLSNLPEEEILDLLGWSNDPNRLDILEKALDQLPAEERALILLFYMKEKSIEEIAGVTGLSLSNVKTKLHRIRKKISILITEIQKKENSYEEKRYFG